MKKKKKKNKGPGSLADTENKTQKKKKRFGQFNWHRKQNPSKKKKNKGPSSAWKLPGQTDTTVTLIYKIATNHIAMECVLELHFEFINGLDISF
jgi:hypothetical protein